MPQDLVLTIIARDRPGLIKLLSEAIAMHGGNWVDSSMARLAGEFAGILRIAVPNENVAALESALGGLGDAGIWVTIRKGHENKMHVGRRVRLEMTGVDHPGIIHEISAVLANMDISIDALDSRVFAGSMSGEAMFEARADIILPEGLDEGQLRETLEDITSELMVEVTLEPVPAITG